MKKTEIILLVFLVGFVFGLLFNITGWRYTGAATTSPTLSLIFSDDFETDLTKWTIEMGSPSLTSDYVFSGTKSLLAPPGRAYTATRMTADTGKVYSGIIEVYFFDTIDLSADEAGISLVVDNLNTPIAKISIISSIPYYSYTNTWKQTNITRSYGWHKARFELDNSYLRLFIDDQLVDEGASTYPYFNKIGFVNIGGTTIIYFDDLSVKENIFFYDGFEEDLSKWALLGYGSPPANLTSEQAYKGTQSLLVGRGTNIHTVGNDFIYNGTVEVYFFDTLFNSGDDVGIVLGDGNARVEVVSSMSTTNYVSAITSYKLTSVSRTYGWHKARFELVNNYLKIYIDDILVDSGVPLYPYIYDIRLVNTGGTGYRSIYFDEVVIRGSLNTNPVTISTTTTTITTLPTTTTSTTITTTSTTTTTLRPNEVFYDDFEIDLSKWREETQSHYSLVSYPIYSRARALKVAWAKLSSINTPIIGNGTVEAFFFDNLTGDGYTGIELWAGGYNGVIGRADLGWSNYYLTEIGHLQISTVIPRTYGWHKVKYELEGGYLKIYIDDILAQEGFPMSSYFDRVGLIGVGSESIPIYFDAISVITYTPLTGTGVDSCLDSDGLNISNQGTVSGYYSALAYDYIDYCRTNDSFLVEYYCTGSYPGSYLSNKAYRCEDIAGSICSNGSCPIIFNPKQIFYEDFETDLSSWEITGLAQITNEIKHSGHQAANVTSGSKISRKFGDFKTGRIEVQYFDINQQVQDDSSSVSILSSERDVFSLLINMTGNTTGDYPNYTEYSLVFGDLIRPPSESIRLLPQFDRSYGWHNFTFEFDYMPVNTYIISRIFIDDVLAYTMNIPDFYLNGLSIFNNVLSPQKYEVYVDDIRAYNYLPSLNLSDIDGDSIIDTEDRLIGDLSNVITNIPTLDLVINQIRLSLQSISTLTGSQSIKVQEGTKDLVDLIWNFDTNTLDLSGVTINKQETNEQKGWLIVKGVSLTDSTKTIYIDNVDQSSDTVCIKDAEIGSISDISSTCTGTNEVLITCPGTNGQYTCEIVNGRYKISGLRNSGVIEVPTEAPPTTGGGGGGSGGGGGGGGGTSICRENWQCTQWSECINRLNRRTCTDLNNCGTIMDKPLERKVCEVIITTSTTLAPVETLVPEEIIELSFLERNKTKMIIIGIAVVLVALAIFKKKIFKKKR